MSVIRHTSSVTLITPHIVGECVCHELLLDVSKRNMWCGACQPVTNVIACVLSATENATMLLDNAFVNDSLISGTKEETT